jgi:hypothetical protein
MPRARFEPTILSWTGIFRFFCRDAYDCGIIIEMGRVVYKLIFAFLQNPNRNVQTDIGTCVIVADINILFTLQWKIRLVSATTDFCCGFSFPSSFV